MNLVFVLCHIALECLHFLFQQAVDTQIRGVRREVINVRSKGSQKKSWWFRRNEETLCLWLKMRKGKPLVVLSHLCRRIVYTFGWDFHISAYVLLFLSHMYWGSFILEIWQRGPRSNQQTCLTWMFGQWGKKRSRKGCVCVCVCVGGRGGGLEAVSQTSGKPILRLRWLKFLDGIVYTALAQWHSSSNPRQRFIFPFARWQ